MIGNRNCSWTEIIGGELAELRKDKRMKLEDVAKVSGLSASTISNYEKGKTAPTMNNLLSLLMVYDCTLTDFFEIEEANYTSDLEVFKRYGFSEEVFNSLLIDRRLGRKNDIVECSNLLHAYPIYAHALFAGLRQFFDNKLQRDMYRNISKNMSGHTSREQIQRMMVEPIIQVLIWLYDAKYPDEKTDYLLEFNENVGKRQKALQKYIVNFTSK